MKRLIFLLLLWCLPAQAQFTFPVGMMASSEADACTGAYDLDAPYAYWNFDTETSNTWADATGSGFTLDESNTVITTEATNTFRIGGTGAAVNFGSSDTHHLFHNSAGALDLSDLPCFTVSMMVYQTLARPNTVFMGIRDDFAGETPWVLQSVASPDRIRFSVGGTSVDYTGGLTAAAKNHLIAWWDGSEICVTLNNDTPVCTAHTTAPPDISTAVFTIGVRKTGAGGFDRGIFYYADEAGIWATDWGSSSTARTCMYNSGSMRHFSALSTCNE